MQFAYGKVIASGTPITVFILNKGIIGILSGTVLWWISLCLVGHPTLQAAQCPLNSPTKMPVVLSDHCNK